LFGLKLIKVPIIKETAPRKKRMTEKQIKKLGLEKLEVKMDCSDYTKGWILYEIGQICRVNRDRLNGKLYVDKNKAEYVIWAHPHYKDIIKRIVEEAAAAVEELYDELICDAGDHIESELEALFDNE
jgi:hypothetical protein